MIPRDEFEEVAGDVENQFRIIRDVQRQQDAQALATRLIVRTLNDRWPGMRRILCDDLAEAIREIERRFALTAETNTPDQIENHKEEIEVLAEMVAELEVDR